REQKGNGAAVSAMEEVVIAAGMGIRSAQLGITECADQRDQAAQQPGGKHPSRTLRHAGHHGRCLEDTGANDDADNQRDGVAQMQYCLRAGRRFCCSAGKVCGWKLPFHATRRLARMKEWSVRGEKSGSDKEATVIQISTETTQRQLG